MAIEHPAWRKRVRRSTTWLVRAIASFLGEFYKSSTQINEAAAALCRKQMLVDFVYQVNTINGEGYDSIPQTRAVIDAVTRGDAQQQHEEDFIVTVNLHDAYRLVEQAAGESRQPVLTISAIQRLHKVLFQNRDGWEAEAGRFRDRDVWVRLKDGSFHQFVEHSQLAPNNAYLVDSEDIVDYGLYRSCFQEEGQHASSSETRDPGRLIAIYTEGLYVGWKKFFVAAGMEAPQTCRIDDDPAHLEDNTLSEG
ncbi:hypothetical protein SELMODRAFT_425000 [Selaginella moellendorffii]|uniref:Uncharacterized protein n=1 Tax=Selaginella moellendorffii TaxID=88036 RepID=D8SRP8_SELML|nr:hypothetical protein SELMODRAFT_425000 [Selaginella moellendorffii]